MKKKTVYESLFWLHALVIFVTAFSGFFLQIWWLIGMLVLWKLHIFIFKGCFLTNAQRKLGVQDEDETFIQSAVKRFTGKTISRKFAGRILFGVFAFAFVTSLVQTFF